MPTTTYPTSGAQYSGYPVAGSANYGSHPGSAASAYNPMTALSNGILWSKMDRDVTTSSASLTSGDPANAAWTKNDCTCVATGTGTQARLTVTAAPTDAYVTITPTNVATGATCVPMTVTVWASYENIRWLIIETRAATANNRAAFDIQNGVIAAPALNMQDSTITAETRNGVAGYRISATCWANGGAMIFRIHGSTASTLTVPAAGETMLLDDATVVQVHAATIANFVSGATFAASSIDARPGYRTDTIIPCLRFHGGQVAYSTEAALTARFVHGGAAPFPSYSLAALCSFRDSVYSAGSGLYGWGNSGTPVDQSGYLGAFGTTAATYAVTARNTGAKNVFSTDTILTDVFVFGVTYDGATGTTLIYRNGVAVAAYTGGDGASFNQQNLINVSCGRVAMGARGAGTATAFLLGDVYEYVKYSDVKSAGDMLSLANGLLTRVA